MSQTHSVPHSLTGCLAILTISLLFVDRFGLTLRVCHLEFNWKAISDGCRSENPGIGGGFYVLSDFESRASVVLVDLVSYINATNESNFPNF